MVSSINSYQAFLKEFEQQVQERMSEFERTIKEADRQAKEQQEALLEKAKQHGLKDPAPDQQAAGNSTLRMPDDAAARRDATVRRDPTTPHAMPARRRGRVRGVLRPLGEAP